MKLPELHLSKPGVSFPETRVDNEGVIRRVHQQFKGSDSEWRKLESAIEHIFHLCNSKYRFLEPSEDIRLADYAAAAARNCLEINGTSLDEVDLVINGGIARQYFEPATAMEIAAKLGLKRTHAFDVTCACVGHLESIQTAAAYLTLHPHYRTALVCTSEFFGHFLSYDIQTVRELRMKAAALTIGNAATCVLLRKVPWPGGGMRLIEMRTHTMPDHWDLCQVPIDGTLLSSSVELMRLGELLPPLLHERFASLGWAATDVDHFVFHQPSEVMVRRLIENAGADPARGVYTHSTHGNTASASVGVTFDQLLRERDVKRGDKLILGSAAAGFSAVVAAGEWV